MNWKLVTLAAAIAAGSANGALIGNWKHDEVTQPLIDSTGGNPNGIPVVDPTYGMPGVPNGVYGAITVTGATGTSIEYGPSTVDEFFVLGADNVNPILNLDAAGNFTVMGWVNPYALIDATARTYRFMSTGSAAGADRGWGIGLRIPNAAGTGSSIRFTTYGIADNDSSTFDLLFNSWVHVAATYSSGVITYFLNGNMLDTDSSTFGNEGAAGRLVIGGRLGGNDTDQMNGLVDGVRVYNTVLTATEIQQAAAQSVGAIPEPSTAMLGLFAGLGLFQRRRRS
jgi:hypothetical protein